MNEFDNIVLEHIRQGAAHSIGITTQMSEASVTHAHEFFPLHNKVCAALVRLHKAKFIDACGSEITLLK